MKLAELLVNVAASANVKLYFALPAPRTPTLNCNKLLPDPSVAAAPETLIVPAPTSEILRVVEAFVIPPVIFKVAPALAESAPAPPPEVTEIRPAMVLLPLIEATLPKFCATGVESRPIPVIVNALGTVMLLNN